MSSAEKRFWQETDRHHDLARKFERNLEITHPDDVECKIPGIHSSCPYCKTSVIRYRYTGEAV